MNYTNQQMDVINAIIKNELPITAKELVEKYNFPESYITSALPRMADRGILIRQGRTMPIENRAGHILWMLSDKTKKEFVKKCQHSEENVNNTENEKIVYDIFLNSNNILSFEDINTRVSFNREELVNIIEKLCFDGKIFIVKNNNIDMYIGDNNFISLNGNNINVYVKNNSGGNYSEKVRNYLKSEKRYVNTQQISNATKIKIYNLRPILVQIANSGKIHSSLLPSIYGKKTYWATSEIKPFSIRPI